MNEVWAHIKTFLLNKGLDIAGAAVVLIVGLWAIKLLTRLVSKSKGFRKADPGAAGFLLSFATVALKLVLFLTVISMLGIPVVNFVTILATAGAAVGLAMQGSLSNLVGGVMLLFFKPFKVGDYIDTHTDAGTVDKISIFYTTLLTPDNRKIAFQRDDRQLFGDGRSAAGFGVHGRVCQRHRAGEGVAAELRGGQPENTARPGADGADEGARRKRSGIRTARVGQKRRLLGPAL